MSALFEVQVHYTLAVRAFQLTGFLAFQLSGKNRSCREQHILTVLWEYVLYMLDIYIYIYLGNVGVCFHPRPRRSVVAQKLGLYGQCLGPRNVYCVRKNNCF